MSTENERLKNTNLILDELTEQMGLEDAPTEFAGASPTAFDIGDDPTMLSAPVEAPLGRSTDESDWRAHQFFATHHTPSGYTFEWLSGPLKGVFFDAPTFDGAAKKAIRDMDRLPAHEHIKHIYGRLESLRWDDGDIEEKLKKHEQGTGIGFGLLAAAVMVLGAGLLKVNKRLPPAPKKPAGAP